MTTTAPGETPTPEATTRGAMGGGLAMPRAVRFAGRGLRSAGTLALTLFATFLGLLLITFIIGRVVPIDPVLAILGERATQAQYETAREALGLNDPL